MIAVYKYVTTLDPDADTELGFYSLDTGQNENPLQGNYFDMNSDHLTGNRYPIHVMDKVDKIDTSTLVLRQLKRKAKDD